AAGHGGQVLVSDPTRVLVEDEIPGGVALRDLGQHRLKDFDAPERIWQIQSEGLADGFPPLRTPQVGPEEGEAGSDDAGASNVAWVQFAASPAFVGRTEEVRVLEDAWSRAAAGRRVLALVSGEPGMGKTALAAELPKAVPDGGGLVLYGRWEE